MQVLTAPAQIYVSKFDGHESIKKDVLAAISEMGEHSFIQTGQQIFNTDWILPKYVERRYWNIIELGVKKFLLELASNFGPADCGVINYWFQQYKQGDYHVWHVHRESMYSCIYYVDMPSGTETTFKINSKEVKFPVTEGEIIAFPSCFPHCSKPNLTGKTKTVIAFNAFVDI